MASAFPEATTKYSSAEEPELRAEQAKRCDIVVFIAHQLTTEHHDVPDLSLPDEQDRAIQAIAGTHIPTVVVLETGGVLTMPWKNCVDAVIAAWYTGHRGAEAIARLLSGVVNISGKTCVTFPLPEQDPPHTTVFPMPLLPGRTAPIEPNLVELLHVKQGADFDAVYDEGLLLGYKWFDALALPVAYPFGHGLSYRSFDYQKLSATPTASGIEVKVVIRNVGERAGKEVVQIYATLPYEAAAPRRLVGWVKVDLDAGERREAVISVPKKFLSVWSVATKRWELSAGRYVLEASASFRDARRSCEVDLVHTA